MISVDVISKFYLNELFFARMWKEIRSKAKVELIHTIFMLGICLADTDTDADWDNVSPDTFKNENELSPGHIARLKAVIELFDKHDLL